MDGVLGSWTGRVGGCGDGGWVGGCCTYRAARSWSWTVVRGGRGGRGGCGGTALCCWDGAGAGGGGVCWGGEGSGGEVGMLRAG